MTAVDRATLRVVTPYVVVAGLWIWLSDTILEFFVAEPAAFAWWSIFKGLAFVVVTAAMLGLLLRAELRRREGSEEALRASREALRSILRASPLASFSLDDRGLVQSWNPASERMFGWSEVDLLGQPPPFVPREKAVEFEGLRTRVMAGESIAGEEVWRRRRDGGLVLVAVFASPLRDRDGAVNGIMAIYDDITERKRNENLVRELIRVVQTLATARDREAVFAAVRTAARQLTGADGASLVLREGDHCHYVDEDAIGPLWKGQRFPVEQCVSGWAMLHGETVVIEDITRDSRVPVDVYLPTFVRSLAMVPLGVAAPVGAIGIYWAHTHRPTAETLELLVTLASAASIALENVRFYTELERQVADRTVELSRAKERAEAADHVKSAFLATMSHELRTPLNSVIGFTGILLQRLAGPLTDEQDKQLGMVQGSARHLLALINDVLDLSKIEAGELAVHQEPVDVRATVEAAVTAVRPLAAAKHLRLDVGVDLGVGVVVSDGRRVQQILLNLLNNAVKFTAVGGVTVTATRDASSVRVEVADTGSGIRPEDLGRLFRPFQQLDAGLARYHEGTGLGLAICQRLAGLLGGAVRVESAWGVGSRFVLELPTNLVEARSGVESLPDRFEQHTG